MARYIDADKLIAHLKDEIDACEPIFDGRANGKSVAYGTELGLKAAISFAETLSVADVVPKSEVARLEQDVTRLVQENEDLKDSNEHLAVMLEETKIELEAMRGAANSYKMHYENLARKIFMDIDRVVEKYSMGDIEYPAFLNIIAELKKKYTEEKE